MTSTQPPEPTPGSSLKITATEAFNAQIRQAYGLVVYSHKVHHKCADINNTKLAQIKFWSIVLSAVTTTSLLIAVFGDTKPCTVIGAVCSTLLLALTAYTKDYDLGEEAQKHIETANKLWVVREDYLSLLSDIAGSVSDVENIQQCRKELQARTAAIYSAAPATNSKAYLAAQKALKDNEEFTFSDREIDLFLPKVLRIDKTSGSPTVAGPGLSNPPPTVNP